MEAGIRCPDPVAGFSRFQREPIGTEHNRPPDTGTVFLLPNPTIFRWLPAGTSSEVTGSGRKVTGTGLRNHWPGDSPLSRGYNYLESHLRDNKSNLLTQTLIEMAYIQFQDLSFDLSSKIYEALFKRKLTIVRKDGSKYVTCKKYKMSVNDQLLHDIMIISLYHYYDDYKTASDIARSQDDDSWSSIPWIFG
jgi:hypothetical protein